jgi:hypothetical protein
MTELKDAKLTMIIRKTSNGMETDKVENKNEREGAETNKRTDMHIGIYH